MWPIIKNLQFRYITKLTSESVIIAAQKEKPAKLVIDQAENAISNKPHDSYNWLNNQILIYEKSETIIKCTFVSNIQYTYYTYRLSKKGCTCIYGSDFKRMFRYLYTSSSPIMIIADSKVDSVA